MAFLFQVWHPRTKVSFAKRTPSHSYVKIKTHLKKTFSLAGLFLYFPSVFASPSGWQDAFFPTAALVPQYVWNQANQQRLLLGLRSGDLPGLKRLKCYVLKVPYVPEVIGTEFKNNQAKGGRYDSSLVIVDQLTMIAMALSQNGSTRLFNLAAAIRVESRKPIEFIVPAGGIEFTKSVPPTIHKLFFFETRIESTRPASLMATLKQTKLLFRWYISNLQSTIKRCRYNRGILISLESNCSPIYVFTKKTSIPAFCFKAQRADELAGEL